jgi:hypothetical protein
LIIAEQAGDDDADDADDPDRVDDADDADDVDGVEDADDADGVDEHAASSRNAQEASAEMAIFCPVFMLARLLAQI